MDAERYLGMLPRNFARLVLPQVPVIELESQKMLDRRDIDAWADLYKAQHGRISASALPAALAGLPMPASQPAVAPAPRPASEDFPRNAILRLREVTKRTGLARSTIYKRVSEGTFPKPVSLGPRSIGWPSAQVDAWLAKLPIRGTNPTST